MTTRTKIICTMGPAVNSLEKIHALIQAGMNVARLNFSHGTHEQHASIIHLLKQAREEAGVPLAIMLDTKGPEIRIGKLREGVIELKEKDRIRFIKENILGDQSGITMTPSHVIDALEIDMFVLLDNGYIITHVVEVDEKGVVVEVDHGGVLSSNKGVNIPKTDIDLPALTEKDRDDIRFGCEMDVDIIAASFIRSAEHVIAIRRLLEEFNKPEISVIAKIENRLGVLNFDSIVQVSDGIMIARGDLGVELPLTEVPKLQKLMIRKCYHAGKPSVTATQMLESMINNPRPTRAEASDVANAIYDSTSAVMLSGETAVGSYPIETVKVMRAIIEESENDFDYYDFLKQSSQIVFPDVPSSVAQASIRTAYTANAKVIFAFTTSGTTARLVSRFRPEMPILAITTNPKVYHQLALFWGVTPILAEPTSSIEDALKHISIYAVEKSYVNYGDLVVITAGTPFGKAGTTNMLIIDSIGDVLVRGSVGLGERVFGKVTFVPCPDSKKEYEVENKILILNECHEGYESLLKEVKGVILQNHVDDVESEDYLMMLAKKRSFSAIVRVEGASRVLREEQLVTIDPTQAIVIKGIVS